MAVQDQSMRRAVYTATLTPQHEDFTFNGELLVKHCHSILQAGSSGIALLGTTGEANSFGLTERKQIIDTVIEGGIAPEKLMIGTGSCAYTETVELTRHVLAHGVKEILLLPPFYYKANDQGLLDYFSKVIDTVADDSLRICLYHFPKMTDIDMSLSFLEQLLARYPEQVKGMKDSSGDEAHMLTICREFPGFELFAGTERYLLPVLRAGGAGCISATANVTVRKMAQVFQNWETEYADALQDELTAIRSVFDGLPFVAILKQYLAQYHEDPAWLPMRPPNSHVSAAVVDKVVEELGRLYFEPGRMV
ncbi:MAG: dihydrodipicolinate synthase family protein [Saprospiraceae bacterium]|nr:dihydrodipicolinate synthase family protein [Lewinella sp.]